MIIILLVGFLLATLISFFVAFSYKQIGISFSNSFVALNSILVSVTTFLIIVTFVIYKTINNWKIIPKSIILTNILEMSKEILYNKNTQVFLCLKRLINKKIYKGGDTYLILMY